ncbi:hypothetical protein AVEN_76614-1 [Araneus ventricosus]|uniref:Uncharacterized protein n=1 Tax=Araneus ventricosus TaxID=182803 RepID=A0A4Y2K8Z2_ARAVE|nr:hypothetical protein AVEN_76614-1 [Araneus ventricosus]
MDGHKNEIRFFRTGDKSPVCVWERWRGGKCVENVVRLEKSGREGESALSKTRKSPVWGRKVGGSQSARIRYRKIKATVVHFEAFVNDLPKSIDFNEWNTNQLLVQME